MRLTPSYGPDPVISLDGPLDAVAAPAIRQRRRLVDLLASLDEAAWSHPSRCEGWTNRDVVVHLDSTNAFWTHSITEGRRGRPTRFLTTFDPVASPAELVAATEVRSGAETVERFAASTDALLTLVEQLDTADWTATAEAPAGHVSVATVVHHALWDGWVHERDIALPLGFDPAVEDDEVLAALRFVAGLGPAFRIGRGVGRTGRIVIDTTSPESATTVEIGDRVVVRRGSDTAGTDDTDDSDVLRLSGDAVDLLEALSTRSRLDPPVASEHTWMVSGLHETFDLAPLG